MGSLKASNPSALLMARIRIIWPAFVKLDEKARQECMNETGRRILDNRFEREKPLVWLVVRGESNPVGSGNEHSTAGSSDTFQANMVAYLRHVVQPLEAQGFQVVVCGDLSTVVEVEDELLVEASFRTVFGRRVQHFGVQAVMIDDRELASITRAWNTMRQQLRIRKLTQHIVGVYIVRADVELKQPGMAEWPKDRYGFLWHTWCPRYGKGVNDMLFYVHERMFRCFEQHLMENLDRWKYNVLPWPAQNEFENAMSIEFDFNHPSDTTRSGNPIYRVTGQKEGFVDTGKFHEHHLLRRRDTSKINALEQLSDADRVKVFTDCCRSVMRTWYSECDKCGAEWKKKKGMPVYEWKNKWYQEFPDRLLTDYLPVRGNLMESLQSVRGLYAGKGHLRWVCDDRDPNSNERRRPNTSALGPVRGKKQRLSDVV